MKTARFTMLGGASMVEEGWATNSDENRAWGVMGFRSDLKEGAPVEGVVVEWETEGEDAHLTVLMPDDHAARWAVAPESGPTNWLPEAP